MLVRLILVGCLAVMAACANRGALPERGERGLTASQLMKSDLDRVAEAHHREVFANLKVLAEKLYRRNPRELKKSGRASVEAGMARMR